MTDPRGRQSRGTRAVPAAAHLPGCAVLVGLLPARPAWAGPAVSAFPQPPSAPGTAPSGDDLPCLPTDPFCAAGQLAGSAVTDLWISIMTSLWQAGLWVLGLAFRVIDALTTPDLSADGPLGRVYPLTFGIGAAVATLMALVQLGAAAFRRDGRSLGRALVGLGQFGLVWAGYVAVAVLLVTGVSGLTSGLLRGLLDIDTLAAYRPALEVDRQLVDGTVATVLGLSSVFLLFPASLAYLLLMLIREAALLILAATSPIAAGGLLAETSRAWFWKSLRWFLAALLISPLAVLILGIGVQITDGVVTGRGDTSAEATIGMAVVGCLLILIGAICPLILFRLLAFVDPGTSSGAAMRQSLAASGGVLGLLSGAGHAGAAVAARGGGGGVAASGAAATLAGDRSQGEATADAATSGRVAGAVRLLGAGSAIAGRLAAGAAASGADVLSGAGVGHPAPHSGSPAPAGRGVPGAGRGSAAQPRPPVAGDGLLPPAFPDPVLAPASWPGELPDAGGPHSLDKDGDVR